MSTYDRERAVKQVIVIRSDLKMRRGKEVAQGAHASMAWLGKRITKTLEPPFESLLKGRGFLYPASFLLSEAEQAWVTGSFAKITVRARSEGELLGVWRKASDAGLEANLIRDAGRTEFHGEPTYTALAVGPDWADLIDPVTGDLELY
jgi:PTH2 family peptidyl-tRNA hydrolase